MDTQLTGTTEEQSSTEQTEETTTSDTSTDGTEDADTKRIVDKEEYLKELDRQIKEKEALRNKAKKSEVPEDADDVITWMTLNSDGLKLVPKEFQEELAFYKSHKIPVTNEIRDRALRDARARKGVREGERQASTATEVHGEVRKSLATDIPDAIKELRPNMTVEQYRAYKAEFDARKKKSWGFYFLLLYDYVF